VNGVPGAETELERAGREAWELFTIPRKRPVSAEERRIRDTAERFVLHYAGERMDAEGDALAGYAWGTGPTVFLAHGWGGNGAQLGSLVAPLVERGLRVVAVDTPAHGESAGLRTNIFEFAGTLEAVVDELGPLHAVIGHSLGGAAAVIGATRGLPLGRLVLIAATARLREEVLKFTRRVELADEVERGMLAHMEQLFGTTVWDDTTLVRLAPQAAPHGLPALVVHDEHDPEVAFADSAELARVWGDGELFATSGLGHVALLRSRDVAARVVDFVAAG